MFLWWFFWLFFFRSTFDPPGLLQLLFLQQSYRISQTSRFWLVLIHGCFRLNEVRHDSRRFARLLGSEACILFSSIYLLRGWLPWRRYIGILTRRRCHERLVNESAYTGPGSARLEWCYRWSGRL